VHCCLNGYGVALEDASTDMGWLWLVGSIKLQVSFAKEHYKIDNILPKRPIIVSILQTVAPPFVYTYTCISNLPKTHFFVSCISRHTCMSVSSLKFVVIYMPCCDKKLQVSSAEYSLFYRALLQKRPIILSILLICCGIYMPQVELRGLGN